MQFHFTLITQTRRWARVEGLHGHPFIRYTEETFLGVRATLWSGPLFCLSLHAPVPQQILLYVCVKGLDVMQKSL